MGLGVKGKCYGHESTTRNVKCCNERKENLFPIIYFDFLLFLVRSIVFVQFSHP